MPTGTGGVDQAPAPRIVLSYAHADTEAGVRVYDALSDVGLNPWIDRREIRPGDSFLRKMNDALEGASYVVLLVSESALASRWVTQEWLAALASDEIVLVPAILEPTALPPLLRGIVSVDFSSDFQSGVHTLIDFLYGDDASWKDEQTRAAPETPLHRVSRRTLRRVALRCMDEATFSAFLFDFEVAPGSLAGASLHERIINLLVRLGEQGTMDALASWLMLEPSVSSCVQRQLRRLENEPRWELPPPE